MATIIFDPTLFRQQFPAYANVTTYPDAMLQMYWDMAICYVSDQTYGFCWDLDEHCRTLALNLMTAHLLYIAGLVADGQTAILINSSTVDKITVNLTVAPIRNQWQWWLSTSPYGQQLWALLQVNSVGGIYIGGLPELSAFRRVGGYFS